jgi:replication factor C subunit 2/4
MNNTNYLWVEKYRPNNLDEISAQSNIIQSLRSSIKSKNIPHLIFFGPSGCGKTSTIISLAKDLFGNENYTDRIIELNASDERGINIIRDKIKTYSKQSIKYLKDAPPWKIIVLDEADTMTTDSQFALRQIMEKYSKITRFCIICNYYNKIIDPIISRCALFRFKPIDSINIMKKLKYICEQEKVNCSDNLLNKIINICQGDLRKAVNLLQKSYNSYDEYINIELLDDVSGIIPSCSINKLMEYILNKDDKNVDIMINKFNLDSYSLVNQIMVFHNYIINSNIDSKKKSQILCKLAEIDQSLIKGCDEYIQFMKLVYFIMIII